MKNQTYTARFEFDEDSGQWTAQLKELPGVITYGRPIKKARERLREALHAYTGDEDHAKAAAFVDEVVESPGLAKAIEFAQEQRAELERMQESTTSVLRDAIDHLIEHGYTMREAAERLGVSFQRVGQLMPGGSRRLAIVNAAERLGITPKRYREILTSMDDVACYPHHRSVPIEFHERVAEQVKKQAAE